MALVYLQCHIATRNQVDPLCALYSLLIQKDVAEAHTQKSSLKWYVFSIDHFPKLRNCANSVIILNHVNHNDTTKVK